jgi:hypothetical protein
MLRAMANQGRRLALTFLLLGCAAAVAAPLTISPQDEEQLKRLVDRHLTALQKEDVAAVMATIHPQSPLRGPTEALLKRVKGKYDFRYTVTDQKAVSRTEEEARVAFTLVTEKVSGPQFRPNRVRGFLVFRKWKNPQVRDGVTEWRLFDTEVAEAAYLEE